MDKKERKVLVSMDGLVIIDDVIIYDPYLISAADMEQLKDYRLVKVRRPGWGKFNQKGD